MSTNYFHRSLESCLLHFTMGKEKFIQHLFSVIYSLVQPLLNTVMSIKFKGYLNKTVIFITYLSDLLRQTRNNGRKRILTQVSSVCGLWLFMFTKKPSKTFDLRDWTLMIRKNVMEDLFIFLKLYIKIIYKGNKMQARNERHSLIN